MPRKDPITGCMVMTDAEFWASEAEQEGKGRCGGDLMSDFYKEWADETRKEEERYTDPQVCLEFVNGVVDEENKNGEEEFPTHRATTVLKVENTHVKDGFKSSGTHLVGIALCDDGRKRRFYADADHYSGDFYEPPSSECHIYWEEVEFPYTVYQYIRRLKRFIPRFCRRYNSFTIAPRKRTIRKEYICWDWLWYAWSWDLNAKI